MVLDPMAGSGATARALTTWGARVITNDLNPAFDCDLCEDALQPALYEMVLSTVAVATQSVSSTGSTTRGKMSLESTSRRRERLVIVTSPWFQLLDLSIPLMMLYSKVLCVQVPATYIVQGTPARMQFLQRLADEGRVHVVAGAGVRNRIARRPTLWLVIFHSDTTRRKWMPAGLLHHAASIQFTA